MGIGAACNVRGDNDQAGGNARGGPVDDIVESRRGRTEGFVARRAMADHRIRRVHRFVSRAARQAEKRGPEHRRNDAV
jgi:hypothetical protein